MSPLLAVAADLLVAVLLVATIVTSLRLSRRMSRMKQDEAAMRAMIAELVLATGKADAAIAGLRLAVRESEQLLAERLGAAGRHTAQLAEQVAAGEAVIERVSRIAAISRRLAVEEVGRSVVSAAPAPGLRSPAPVAHAIAAEAPAAGEPDEDRLQAAIRLARDVAERSARRVSGRAAA